ncbi:MAG: NERD domain-containing protein [Acholeplasmataceae bacterium]|jgi:hypothetical protein|nr:NERD domain-containing protein [Acholeplasmataceae bacterium]
MKKNIIFKVVDLVLYFNVLLFLEIGIQTFKQNLFISFGSFTIMLLNLVYAIYMSQKQLKSYQANFKKLEIESQVEAKIKEETDLELDYIRKTLLDKRVEVEVKNVFPKSKFFRNVSLKNNSQKLDLIVIFEKGVLIVETINLTGRIKGTWQEENLTALKPDKGPLSLVNPLIKNADLQQLLENLLSLDSKYFKSIVVFGNNTIIESFINITRGSFVCTIDYLAKILNKLKRKPKVFLDDQKLSQISKKLLPLVEK